MQTEINLTECIKKKKQLKTFNKNLPCFPPADWNYTATTYQPLVLYIPLPTGLTTTVNAFRLNEVHTNHMLRFLRLLKISER